MSARHSCVLAVAVILAVANGLNAVPVVFSDDFDGPTTWPGGRNNGDGIPGVHPPDVGVDPWGGSGTLRAAGGGFPAPSAGGGTFYAQPGSPNMTGFLTPSDGAATLNKVVNISWDMYLQGVGASGALGNSFEFGGNDTVDGNVRGYDLFFRHNGTLDVYTNSFGFVTAPGFSFPTDQWVSASLTVDYATGAQSLTIGSQTTNFLVSDSAAVRLDKLLFQDYSGGTNLALFDNIVAVVPEPAALSLVGIAAVGLVRRRRKS